jgi:hypothetical protein
VRRHPSGRGCGDERIRGGCPLPTERYAIAATAYQAAYAHMFMTRDLLTGAIAKQKNLK